MTRLRFIVDRPRGKRGGHNDERHLFKSLSSAKESTASKKGITYNNRVIRPDRSKGRVLMVDVDMLLPHDATVEEQFAYHERMMLHHTTEAGRLKPHAELGVGKCLTTTDMALVREAISEWDAEEDRLRRGGGATPAAAGAFFLLRDLWREGKLG